MDNMTMAQKIERCYNKWVELNDNAQNEFDQRKADRKYNQLVKLFSTKEEFNTWWQSKMNYKSYLR